jgi:hypothetical protein
MNGVKVNNENIGGTHKLNDELLCCIGDINFSMEIINGTVDHIIEELESAETVAYNKGFIAGIEHNLEQMMDELEQALKGQEKGCK